MNNRRKSENKKELKGEKIKKVLELLQGGAEVTTALLDVFLCDYHTSYRKMQKMIWKGHIPHFKTDWVEAYRERQRFYALLNKLKREGLVTKEIQSESSLWRITEKGLDKLQVVRSKKEFDKYSADYSEHRKKSSELRVVIFDIPEKERHKREWMRYVLISLNFSLLQNSVWIGKNSIPEKLIHDLKEKKMMGYVHIFGVGDQGTINKII